MQYVPQVEPFGLERAGRAREEYKNWMRRILRMRSRRDDRQEEGQVYPARTSVG